MEWPPGGSIRRPGRLPPFDMGLGNRLLDIAFLFVLVWVGLFVYGPGPPGAFNPFKRPSILHRKSVLCGGFIWACGALNGPKRRFPARAVYTKSRWCVIAYGACVIGAPRARGAKGVFDPLGAWKPRPIRNPLPTPLVNRH